MTKLPIATVRACGLALVAALATAPAWAKLPPPSEEAKAKAAEAAAKAAWTGKVEGYQLCKSMDATAARYYADAKKAGKDVKPPVTTPACTDPGPFAYTPAAAAPGMPPAASPATAPAAAPAAAPAPVTSATPAPAPTAAAAAPPKK